MAVHSIHIFDRRGKTLFTKRYASKPSSDGSDQQQDAEQLAEQRKLVFGMLFSLRELVTSLAPEDSIGGKNNVGLHSVRTAAGTLHNYETISGMRIALYTTNNNSTETGGGSGTSSSSIRSALKYIYTELWVELVVRSPLYRVGNSTGSRGTVATAAAIALPDQVSSTNFEQKLDSYLSSMPWFR